MGRVSERSKRVKRVCCLLGMDSWGMSAGFGGLWRMDVCGDGLFSVVIDGRFTVSRLLLCVGQIMVCTYFAP